MLRGSYDVSLVLVSVMVAVLASFTALTMAGRTQTASTPAGRWAWRLAGGVAMGCGIWSMHFVGMLAFSLPIPLGYALDLTLASLLAAIAASVFALWLASLPALPRTRLFAGALLMGGGIATMHYVGMAALRMQPSIDWDPAWVAISLLIAIAACWVALHLAFRARDGHMPLRARSGAAMLLGVGIVGMHYTGMAAARFPEDAVCGAVGRSALPPPMMAWLVVAFTLLVLGLALGLAWMEQRMEATLLRMRNAMLSSSLDAAHSELSQAALHDPLTRLPNRRLLQQHIDNALARAEQDHSRFAVMFLDLDGFKQVNDLFGHQAGDALLVAVSERIGRLMRPGDVLARLGGDEFVLLAPLDCSDDVTLLAQRILQSLDSDSLLPGLAAPVSASIGIALCPDHATTERQLMSHADTAMYQAKHAGRNRHVLFAAWMNESAEQQFQMLADLKGAVAAGQLSMHYQPRRRTADGQVAGAEALIRWQHPSHGDVPAEHLVRLAERSGMISEIGRWALQTACAQLRGWHDAGHVDWTVSVNLSPLQFGSPQLVGEVATALQRHRLPSRCLILEITEATVMRDTDASIRLLQELAALGVGIAIDDFGTGYSSLLHLKRLPATELKIDPAFLQDLEHSPEDVVIVSSMVALAHALDMVVVAEGVETPAQRAYLERLGCDYLQGFLLGRPVPPARFLQLHGERRPRVEIATGGSAPTAGGVRA